MASSENCLRIQISEFHENAAVQASGQAGEFDEGGRADGLDGRGEEAIFRASSRMRHAGLSLQLTPSLMAPVNEGALSPLPETPIEADRCL